MPARDYRIAFRRTELEALEGPVDIERVKAELLKLTLDCPIIDIRPLPHDGVSVEWASACTEGDELKVAEALRAFAGAPLTSEPFAFVHPEPVAAVSEAGMLAAAVETPPLEAGRYAVRWTSELRLTQPASSTAARAQCVVVDHFAQTHHTRDTFSSAFNGSVVVDRAAGDTLRIALYVAKIGPGAVSAEIASIHVFVDKIR